MVDETLEQTRDRLTELDRRAQNFYWRDRDADLSKLFHIAHRYNPEGKFSLIQDFHLPEDEHEQGWVRLPPALCDWMQYLDEKYGNPDVTTMIMIRFGRIVCCDGPPEHTYDNLN